MKKRIKTNLLLIALTCSVQISKGQYIDSLNRDLLVKNIISYHFKYTPDFELHIKNGNLLENNSYFFYDLWPKPKDSLIMEIENVNVDYPKPNYKIYHVIKRGIQFFSDTSRRQYDFTYFLFATIT